MNIRTIKWQDNAIKIIDQTKLPAKLCYIYIKDLKSLWQAIKEMQVRGAPALGAAAGLGVYLGLKDLSTKKLPQFKKRLAKIINFIASSRPTARNLFWGLERMRNAALLNKDKPLSKIKKILFEEAQKIISEDKISCRKIGDYGSRLIKQGDALLTICNAGILATIDYGTALGIIYSACAQGKVIKVYACETRPMLQGARLTAWELKQKGVSVTLVCDMIAATLMRQGKVNKVIVGADRIAANGDSANKVGTYNLAILAHYHRLPFYVAAPASTFDLKIDCGEKIPIEERDGREITEMFFKKPVAPKGIKVINPAFDVTPHNLITAIITDKGVIKPPYKKNITKLLGE